MVRRTTRTLALVATLLLVFPAAALAYNVSSDGTISSSTDTLMIRVGFANRFEENQPDRLFVSIAGEDLRVRANCVRNCETQISGGSSVFALPISARGGTFSSPTNRVPNGRITFEVRGSGTTFGERQEFRVGTFSTTIDVPGSAVGSLSRTVSDGQVNLSWTAAPEAGISGYRVERVTGDRTTEVTTTSGTSAVDRPGPGEHRYRVVTVRPKAGDGSHETVSNAVTAVVERPQTSSDEDGDGDSSGNGDGSSGGSSGGDGTSNGGRSGNGSSGGSTGGSDDGGSSSSPSRATGPNIDRDSSSSSSAGAGDDAEAPRTARDRSRVRTGQAPNVASDRGGFGTPELPRVGDIFRGELDFDGDGDGEGGNGNRNGDSDDEVVLSAPGGGFGSFLGSGEEAERIAVPIAGGLLLTAIGLHLWRWLKVPLT